MKILFTTPVLLHPPAGGPELRIENSIKALFKISELHIISRVNKKSLGSDNGEIFYKKYCKNFVYAPSTCPHSFFRRALNKIFYILFKQKPFMPDNVSMDANFIVEYAKDNDIKIVWFGYGNISYSLMRKIKDKTPDLRLVCDTDSVWSRYVLRRLPFEMNLQKKIQIEKEGKQKEKEEADWVRFCDITTAVSEVDAAYYKSISDEPAKIKLFSNVIDVESYRRTVPPPANHLKPCIYLAGSFWKDSPMEIAARWVIEKVLPVVKKKFPDIHFYIIGRGSNLTLADIHDNGITITGMLESVLPYLCNVDVSLVPLSFESGTRFKILESGACSIPMVSTTLGAEGIPVKHNEHILIADDPLMFAESIIELINNKDKAKVLAENCRKLVEEKFSVEALEEEGRDIINQLH